MVDTPREVENWPALIRQIGASDFAARLVETLAGVAPFDLSVLFAYPGRERPVLLHDGLKAVSPPQIMANYLEGTYLLDAVYAACRVPVADGLYRLRDLAPDDFFEADYFHSPDVHPCISMESGALAEEIVFITTQNGVSLALSLMRQNGSKPFSEAEFSALAAAAPMVTALLAQNWRDLSAPVGDDGIEQAFSSFAPEILTGREQAIVSLILRGHSSASIGRVLGIAEGTVKIHRKHIHAKLGISSQGELFALFVSHVLRR